MSIPRNYPAGESYTDGNPQARNDNNDAPEPLSGSKKVKNRNHSGAKQHSEGSGHRG